VTDINCIETVKELPTGLPATMQHTVFPMKLDSPEADRLFTALGNKTRRRILQRLSEQPARSISELAREFGISNTAAANQITVLEEANLISRVQHGKYQRIQIQHEFTSRMNGLLRLLTIS
jgi:DNA-binding transcriptional ArsR family regulator